MNAKDKAKELILANPNVYGIISIDNQETPVGARIAALKAASNLRVAPYTSQMIRLMPVRARLGLVDAGGLSVESIDLETMTAVIPRLTALYPNTKYGVGMMCISEAKGVTCLGLHMVDLAEEDFPTGSSGIMDAKPAVEETCTCFKGVIQYLLTEYRPTKTLLERPVGIPDETICSSLFVDAEKEPGTQRYMDLVLGCAYVFPVTYGGLHTLVSNGQDLIIYTPELTALVVPGGGLSGSVTGFMELLAGGVLVVKEEMGLPANHDSTKTQEWLGRVAFNPFDATGAIASELSVSFKEADISAITSDAAEYLLPKSSN